ncbi:MAG: hypothetical protein ACOCQA_03665 [bacterium]
MNNDLINHYIEKSKNKIKAAELLFELQIMRLTLIIIQVMPKKV